MIGIGNSILSIPLIMDALKHFGRENVDILVGDPASRAIFEKMGIGRRIVCLNGGWLKRIESLRRLKQENYDSCSVTFPALSLIPEWIPLLIGARSISIHDYSRYQDFFRFFRDAYSHCVPVDEGSHDIEQNLNLAAGFGKKSKVPVGYPEYRLSIEDKETIRSFREQHAVRRSDKVILMHPGSRRENDHKRWPLERFLELTRQLTADETRRVFFLIGPDEKNLLRELEGSGVPCLFNVPIPRLMPIMKSADLFISNDSGMMHLASLAGAPIIALWGATDPRRNSARARRVINIIPRGPVCRPCIRITRSRACDMDFRCIRSISPKELCRAADHVLRENRGKI